MSAEAVVFYNPEPGVYHWERLPLGHALPALDAFMRRFGEEFGLTLEAHEYETPCDGVLFFEARPEGKG